MNFPDLVELLFETWLSGSQQAVMMLGKPGIGKTAVGRALAAQGFVTVVPDYRLWPEVRFPDFLEDCAAAAHHNTVTRNRAQISH